MAARGGSKLIKLAILAVGGQGGGVLTTWITTLAERQGYWAQATSVAGVAQRTGATIYYIEMTPKDAGRADRPPVFALAPAPGDVDILIAAELAEAGRAILRGFVTDRTTLIASSHRQLAVSEKIVPGDGRTDGAVVLEHARKVASRLVAFDMEEAARASGAHVSAALFGALAASGTLPFPRAAFEATIEASGRGVERSLRAFADAHERASAADERPTAPGSASADPKPAPLTVPERPGNTLHPGTEAGSPDESGGAWLSGVPLPKGPERLVAAYRALIQRTERYPPAVADMAAHGLAKVVDFLDVEYGAEYLDRLDRAVAVDAAPHAFSRGAAKHLANAMAYDDLPRVADLKLRAARSARIRSEAGATGEDVVETLNYFHPRMVEVAATLPASLGVWLVARPRLMARLARFIDRGRRIRTDRIGGFALLAVVAALRPHRRRLLRHRTEIDHVDRWLGLALEIHAEDRALGLEVLNCRRLIKGYSDTHARGLSKFDRTLAALPALRGRADAADWLRRLTAAALQDPDGRALDGALRTIATFADRPGSAGVELDADRQETTA